MSETRIAKWDNIKFLMILCVVSGHTIYYYVGSSALAKSIYLFFYTFHMPVFIYLAGMLSKRAVKEKRYEAVIEYLFIYFVMKFMETFSSYLANGRVRFWEDGPAWFGLAMACFLLATMLIKDYNPRYMLAFAFLIGCLAGLDNHLGDHFVSMRICVFYPVYLAGYYTNPYDLRMLVSSRSKKLVLKISTMVFLTGCFAVSVFQGEHLYPLIKLLKGKYPYEAMGYGIYGVVYRLLCYGFWTVMIYCVIMAVTEKKRIYSWLGQRTMSTFIWHNFFIVLFMSVFHGKKLLRHFFPNYYVIASICIAVLIAIISAYFLRSAYQKK